MRALNRISFFLMLSLLVILLAACGDSFATSAPATLGSTTAASTTLAARTTAAATTYAAAATTTQGGATAQATPAPASDWDRKIIRNASLWTQTNDVEQMLTQLREIAKTEGGYISAENTTQQQNDRPSAVVVMQVPSQQYESTITRIRQAALKVTREESGSQDVTEEYVDLQSQITNLKKTEENLQKLMDKAQKLEDIMALQKELTSVRGEIEKRQGRLNFLGNRSALSSITVNISLPPLPPEPTATPRPVATNNEELQADKVASDSWNASLKLLGGAALVVIKVGVFFWWLLPFLLIGSVWLWIKRPAPRRDKWEQK